MHESRKSLALDKWRRSGILARKHRNLYIRQLLKVPLFTQFIFNRRFHRGRDELVHIAIQYGDFAHQRA